jgi:branched-chain amino acid transport system substrate-binding protein
MENHSQSGAKTKVVRRGIAVGFAVLLLAAFLWVTAATATATSPDRDETGATDSSSKDAVITIGVGAAQSVVPEMGWRQINAAQLAVDQVNAAGGINIAGTNYTLALAVANDGCNAGQAITAANTLLNAGAVAVVGYTCSGASNAAQPIHAAAGVPMISPSSTGPGVTEQGYRTTFRTISRDDSPPILLATYLRDWLHLEQAAIVEIDGFWGNWATDVVSATFASLGGAITSRRTVASTAEFTAVLTAIQAESPDVIFYSDADASNAGLLSSVAHSLGMADVVIAWNTFSDDETLLAAFAAQAGEAAEGDHAALFYRRTQDMPGYVAFNTAYQAAGFANYGDEATATGAFAYDAANIIVAAIVRAQSTNPADIRNAIASTTNYQGVVGAYQGFNAKGDVIPQWAWLERHTNDRWTILHPSRILLPVTLRKLGWRGSIPGS